MLNNKWRYRAQPSSGVEELSARSSLDRLNSLAFFHPLTFDPSIVKDTRGFCVSSAPYPLAFLIYTTISFLFATTFELVVWTFRWLIFFSQVYLFTGNWREINYFLTISYKWFVSFFLESSLKWLLLYIENFKTWKMVNYKKYSNIRHQSIVNELFFSLI